MTSREFVRSNYRARWYGLVLSRQARKGYSDLLTILVLRDKAGRLMKRRTVVTLDERWTIPIPAMDLAEINKEWYE